MSVSAAPARERPDRGRQPRERARAIERAKMRGTAGGAVGCFMDLISRARVGIALPCCAGVFRQ